VTEKLRNLMRTELGEERPPPLGDLVGTAMRDGRRIRRVRRLGLVGVGAAVLGVVALTATVVPGMGSPAAPVQPAAPPPVTAPIVVNPSVTVPPAFQIREDGTAFPVPVTGRHTTGKERKVTSGAMLQLLTELLPTGRTSGYAVAGDENTHVQIVLTTKAGTGMIRASLEKDFTDRTMIKGYAAVTVDRLPDNCVQSIVVDAALPNGANLALNIASCVTSDGRQYTKAPQIITPAQAVEIVTDPRWGLTMDAQLVVRGDKRFPDLPAMR
jgi:hypothetical protein